MLEHPGETGVPLMETFELSAPGERISPAGSDPEVIAQLKGATPNGTRGVVWPPPSDIENCVKMPT
jgi:hypothetical protein